MTESTNEYWLTRAQNVIDTEAQEDAKAMTDIERIILLMYAEIAREILAFYAKYAKSQGLAMQDAIRVADQFDVVAFQQQAKKLVETKDFSDEATKVLKTYNTKMNISREKLLKQQLDLIVKRSGIDIEHKIEDKLVDAVDREVERQAGILGEHVKIDDTHVKVVVNSNFKGVTWSKRLWKDMAQVQKEVERITSHVILRGRHPNEFVSTFKKKTTATTYNAKRLLITESARVQAEAQKLTYLKELGEDAKYKYVAKIDSKTSKLCHSLNGEVFKVKDMTPGVNAPPMHQFCRSTTVPHVGNWRDQFFKERKGKYKLEYEDNNIKQSGALNDKNDPYMKKRFNHANMYYESVRRRNKKIEIKIISKNSGLKDRTIKRVYEHIFENEYTLAKGKTNFDPDFEMANSWQRLREGKNIKKADIIMLRHEALEHYLMNKYNFSYKEAHNVVEKRYNYNKELKKDNYK